MSFFKRFLCLNAIPALLGLVLFALGGLWGASDASIGIVWGCIYGGVTGVAVSRMVRDMMHHGGWL